jgi:hypothetical protein
MSTAATTEMPLTIREYAKREGITLQAAYLRVWNERVSAVKDGREWRVLPEEKSE